ncbi:MAG: winged helix-turn-helix transcriptional regulator [Deltaproteobacteria bacterium]|nr:winged helix-turn-helix transcriptional regulator [Deltaproteobacteria bacterium]
MDKEDLHMLRLMGEIDRDGNHSQRELSSKLNLSLGLVNTFLKRLVNKGYFKMTTMPRNRVKYFLTPEGLARKSRLTAEYLRYSVSLYRDIKTLLLNKYQEMKQKEVKKILFFGAGEEAELAYLYLQLTDIQLVGVVAETPSRTRFFDFPVAGPERLKEMDWDMILLTRLDDTEKDLAYLLEQKIPTERIATI